MNTQSLERQLQQIDPPAPDPQARLSARRAALAEFARHHAQARRPALAWHRWHGPWVAGLAAASVAVIGVAIFWQVPEAQRELALAATTAEVARVPAEVAQVPAEQVRVPSGLEQQPASLAPVVEHQDPGTREQAAPSAEPLAAGKLEAPVASSRIDAPSTLVAVEPSAAATEHVFSEPVVVSVADALAALSPAALSPLRPVTGTGTDTDRGQPFIDKTIANLRGLDPTFGSRTLTLVDSRRTVVTMPVIPPPAARGDQFEGFETNAVKSTVDEPVSTFSVDVDTTSYSFVRRMLNSGQLPPADAVRAEEMINYFDYAWPAPPSRQQPFRPTVTVSNSPWGEGRKLVHVGIRGYELPTRSQPDANLVMLLDVSGSMNAPDKLPLVKQSMKLLLDSLKPTDTVSIVVYAGAAGQVLPPTAVRDRETIEAALDGLRPGGSTAGAQGIRLAYDLAQRSFRNGGVNRILLATDGDFNVGVSDPQELERLIERERGRGVYLSVLGFGQGNYRDDIAQALAQNGNGVAAYIDTLSEARKVLVREATSSLFTIAGDVKIQVEFNPATVAEYRLVGYETRALNREDFNNDKVDAGDVGSGRTVTAIYEITPADSPARMIEAPRYAAAPAAASARGKANEYGFVKIRYKLPGAEQSQLLEQPIRVDADVPRALREDVAFSTAVAGFAQLLRDGRYTGTLTYEDILRQAASNRGQDPYGYRAEFLELVRKAQQSADAAATRE